MIGADCTHRAVGRPAYAHLRNVPWRMSPISSTTSRIGLSSSCSALSISWTTSLPTSGEPVVPPCAPHAPPRVRLRPIWCYRGRCHRRHCFERVSALCVDDRHTGYYERDVQARRLARSDGRCALSRRERDNAAELSTHWTMLALASCKLLYGRDRRTVQLVSKSTLSRLPHRYLLHVKPHIDTLDRSSLNLDDRNIVQ